MRIKLNDNEVRAKLARAVHVKQCLGRFSFYLEIDVLGINLGMNDLSF